MDGRFSRRRLIKGGLVVAASPLLAPTASAAPALPWPAAEAIVARTKRPVFPDRTFSVLDFGAKGDGKTDDTAAIRKAIETANARGGGHVVVPKGTFVTGAVYLKSNVDLHLAAGAVLAFGSDASKFPNVLTRYEGIECVNRSPMIYAYKESNIAVTGKGTLDAAGTASWNKGKDREYLESLVAEGIPPERRIVPGSGHALRSTFVEPYSCDTVLIEGITLKNPMFWQLHPTLCRNVTIDGVRTDASTARSNTDACDPESCDHVVIVNSHLGAHDDNIALKSGRDDDGRRIGVPCQNIVVAHCVMDGNWGAITCGSEQTGGIRNVYAYKLTVTGETKYGLYVKSNTLRGGFTENVNLAHVSGTFVRSVVYVLPDYNGQTGAHVPRFGPFTLSRSSGTKCGQAAFNVRGLPDSHVRGLRVSDCRFDGVANPANTLNHVDDLRFENTTINGEPV